jgi:glucosamine--fructose-6-phosphate aminotransferase (isomerizing)
MTGLNLLKNRGYDSCGVYLNNKLNDNFLVKYGIDGDFIKNSEEKDIFKILERDINLIENPQKFEIGIGHTRWATHGGKTDFNSHPHKSNNNLITVVHNGIISNYHDIKEKYLSNFTFKSSTDTEVVANLIQYLKENVFQNMNDILSHLNTIFEGTWALLIHDSTEPNRLYFMKNENPLLLAKNDEITIATSEPSGFMNMVSKYILLRDKTYGYMDNTGNIIVKGEYKELDLIKCSMDDIELSSEFPHWMYKEIIEQSKLSILTDPITNTLRYNNNQILFNLDFIKSCKYLYIIACGSSYYAGLIASNYFRATKAFEFVNVFDGGEFTKGHLEAIEDPEKNLLILLISQSGETRDLNIATTICREYSSNRRDVLEKNNLLKHSDSFSISEEETHSTTNELGEIKIIGIINVIGSLISRRTIDNIYTNCGRENAVASSKSCTSQILACLLLAIYKSELNNKLSRILKDKFFNDLNRLELDILEVIHNKKQIEGLAEQILALNKNSIFLLGKDELHGSALEGALKIKEIAYIHAEGFNIAALKHGPYALLEENTPIIIIYKGRDHFVKSIIEETKTRGAYVIEISPYANKNDYSFKLPDNKTFTGLLAVVALQLLSYYLSVKKGINPDRPRNLAKVVTVD